MRVRDKVIYMGTSEQGRLQINSTRGYGVGLGIHKLKGTYTTCAMSLTLTLTSQLTLFNLAIITLSPWRRRIVTSNMSHFIYLQIT